MNELRELMRNHFDDMVQDVADLSEWQRFDRQETAESTVGYVSYWLRVWYV